MKCLKCGREIEEGRVFCPDCLSEMDRHPVKPGTKAVIHPRETEAPAPAQKIIPPEELLARSRKQNRSLKRWVTALGVLLVLTLGVLSYGIYRDFTVPAIGQNYNTETTPTTVPASTAP